MVEATATRQAYLEALSLELRLRGFEATLGTTRTGVPLLTVTNPAQPSLLCENIPCVTGMDDVARFAWPWGTYLAPADDMALAVAEVLKVLGTGDG